MRSADRVFRRNTRRFAVVAALVIALFGGFFTPSAWADETDQATKEKVAGEVSIDQCSRMPNWTSLNLAVYKVDLEALNPRGICEGVVKAQLLDQNSAAVRQQCRAGIRSTVGPLVLGVDDGLTVVSGKDDGPLVQTCITSIQNVLVSAIAAFDTAIDKAGAAAEMVECAVNEGLRCIVRQYAELQGDFVNGLWDAFFSVLTKPSAATSVFAAFDADSPSSQQSAFASVYRDVGLLSASVVLIMALIGLISAAVQGHLGQLKSTLLGVAAWGFTWIAGLGVAALFLAMCDGAAKFLAGQPSTEGGPSPIEAAGERIAEFVEASVVFQFDTGTMTPSGSAFAAMLIGLVLLLAIGAALITLAFRDMSLLLMGIAMPLLLALQAGPKSARAALPKAVAAFAAAAVAKPLMVLGLRLGSAFLTTPTGGTEGLYSVALGAMMLLLVAFCPGVVYRLFSVVATNAGASFGAAGPGFAQQSLHAGRSMMSTSAMTKSVLSANGTGTTAAAGAGGRLGAARMAMPVLGAAAVAAETVSTGVKSMASQVATAGGALGDAEKGHVPHPGHGGGSSRGAAASASASRTPRASSSASTSGAARSSVATTPRRNLQPARMPSSRPAAPAAPPSPSTTSSDAATAPQLPARLPQPKKD